ncbi:uncharacterized protein J3D65DRAFT_419213 [Phyllosticta citribraziliensis]|uniref:Uncharacterized protein n=1 Tax=Phyllosticta citribraziliensis TaxID=989973 RepID=A0ABR1LMM9_9PEZI
MPFPRGRNAVVRTYQWHAHCELGCRPNSSALCTLAGLRHARPPVQRPWSTAIRHAWPGLACSMVPGPAFAVALAAPRGSSCFCPHRARARAKKGLAGLLSSFLESCVHPPALPGRSPDLITGTCCLTSPLPARHAVPPEQRTSTRIRPAPRSSEYGIISSQWCFAPLRRRQAKPLRFGEAVE